MLTCTQAHAAIAQAVDDETPLEALESLRQHLAICDQCRDELETQFQVKRLLASRAEEALPLGFGERLAARLSAEPGPDASRFDSWPATGATFIPGELVPVPRSAAAAMDFLPWRTWSLRLVPLAAVLLIFVARAGRQNAAPVAIASPEEAAYAAGESTGQTGVAGASSGVGAVAAGPDESSRTPPTAAAPRASATASGSDPAALSPRAARDRADAAPQAQAAGARAAAGVQVDGTPANGAQANATETGGEPAVPTTRTAAATPASSPFPAQVQTQPLGASAGPLLAPARTPAAPNVLAVSLAQELRSLAQELRLNDQQRRQIEAIYNSQRQMLDGILERERRQTDAAIERVLTPEQREQYRELNGSRGWAPTHPGASQPGASQPGSSLPNALPRPPSSPQRLDPSVPPQRLDPSAPPAGPPQAWLR